MCKELNLVLVLYTNLGVYKTKKVCTLRFPMGSYPREIPQLQSPKAPFVTKVTFVTL